MSFSGDLSSFSFPRLLEGLGRDGSTGVLIVTSRGLPAGAAPEWDGPVERRFYVQHGRVVGAENLSLPEEGSLRATIEALDLLDPATLAEATRLAERRGQSLLQILVDEAFLDREKLSELRRGQIVAVALGLWSTDAPGRFTFRPGALPPTVRDVAHPVEMEFREVLRALKIHAPLFPMAPLRPPVAPGSEERVNGGDAVHAGDGVVTDEASPETSSEADGPGWVPATGALVPAPQPKRRASEGHWTEWLDEEEEEGLPGRWSWMRQAGWFGLGAALTAAAAAFLVQTGPAPPPSPPPAQLAAQVPAGDRPPAAAPAAAPVGRVDLNSADADTIATATGISRQTAQNLVRFRAANGPFGGMDEVMRVPGIGAEEQAALQAAAAVAPPKPPPAPPSRAHRSNLININTASSRELQKLPRVGPATAQRIIDYRQQQGPFKRPEDIMRVKGIGPKTFARMKDAITVD